MKRMKEVDIDSQEIEGIYVVTKKKKIVNDDDNDSSFDTPKFKKGDINNINNINNKFTCFKIEIH